MQLLYVKLICALAVIFDGTGRCVCEEVKTPPKHEDVQLVVKPTFLEIWNNLPKYTCTVFYKKEGIASGIILTERHVLTTCKTVINGTERILAAKDVKILRGTFNSQPGKMYIKSHEVKRITPHPQCIDNKVFNNKFDLAIIKLLTPMAFNQYFAVAELFPESFSGETNKRWFLSNFRVKNVFATVLEQSVWMVESGHVDNEICQDPAYYSSPFDIEHHFCSAYDHSTNYDNKCPLDVGSSIAYEGKVIGLLIEKVSCGGPHSFAKFVNIEKHTEWIEKELSDDNRAPANTTATFNRKVNDQTVKNITINILPRNKATL